MNRKFSRCSFLNSCVAAAIILHLSPMVILGGSGLTAMAAPAEYFVSPQGSDEADGSRSHPPPPLAFEPALWYKMFSMQVFFLDFFDIF